MSSLISQLNEKIILCTINNSLENTTEKMFSPILSVRANITTLYFADLYQVIISIPPQKFIYTNFTGLQWNNMDYKFVSQFKIYQQKFLKGNVCKLW